MTHALHCNPLCFYPGSDGSNTALSSKGKKDSFVLSNKVIQMMAIHVWLFVTMGRTSHTPPTRLTIVPVPATSLTVLPTVHSALVTESPLPLRGGAGCVQSATQLPLFVLPT